MDLYIFIGNIMITYKQFITEIFESSNIYNWRITERFSIFSKSCIAKFNGQNDSFKVSVDKTGNSYIVDFYSSKYGIFLSGINDLRETLKIYNTIVDIITKIILNESPPRGTVIKFFAMEPKTEGVYLRLAQQVSRKIGGRVTHARGGLFEITL